MATLGFSAAVADDMLNAFANATAYTGVANLWVQLHTADPGPAGTTAIATETERKESTFAVAGGDGTCANDAAVTWVSIDGSEDATHFSLWSLVTGGVFQGNGLITANAYTAGDTYNIAIGALVVSTNIAAA